MTKARGIVRAGLAALAWIAIGVGGAHAALIVPVDTTVSPPFPTIDASPVTVSIFSSAGADITETWLPTWSPTGGEDVFVVVNTAGAPLGAVSLTPPPPAASIVFTGSTNPFLNGLTPTTSAYPGKCTNYGSPADPDYLAPDFTLGAVLEPVPNTAFFGYRLTSNDCGGMAVISAVVDGTPRTFILPQDSNGNGVPDIFETVFCPPTSPCPTGREDADASAGNAVNGDGLSVFDEYRGFIVSGAHIRTDPRRKDLFVHLVNPQCVPGDPLASTASLLGGVNAVVTGSPLFSNVEALVSGTQIHRLGYATPNATHLTTNEWVDRFHHYSVADGVRFGDGTVSTQPADDRQVNRNAVYFTVDALGQVPQRGLRLIECLDTSSPSLFGFASLGSPNGRDNAILYTQNIVNYFTGTLGAVCATPATACLSYSTFQNGAWTAPAPISPSQLFAAAFAFYLAMEIGHTVVLTPTLEGDRRTSYGYHHAPGTGSNLDQTITNKVSTKTGNTFYVPLLYNTSDLSAYKVR